MLAVNLGIIMSALGSAVVLAYAKEIVSEIPRYAFPGNILAAEEERIVDGVAKRPALNFLLVGVDSVANLPPGHILRSTRPASNTLTDTIILLRVDPESGDAWAMSLPRDLWLPVPEPVGRETKINAALPLGGQAALLQAIQDFLDIPIHRYLQVDFNGFLGLVDEIGGVEVQIDFPLRDPKAQFEITRTGCVNLTPEEALGYVRSRTLQALINGGWSVVDNRGDLGRIQRQQDFLVVALKKAFSEGLTSPTVLKGLIDNVLAAGYISLDVRTTPADMLELASDFASFNADELERLTLPVVLGSAGAASVVRMVEGEAEEVLAVFRGERDDPRSFRLVIQNGTPIAGLAREVEFALSLNGFRVVETKNAANFQFQETIIRYDPSQLDDARELQRWLGVEASLDPRNKDGGRPVDLIIGSDWEGILARPRAQGAVSAPTAESEGSGPAVINTDPVPQTSPTPTPTPAAVTTIRGCGS